MSTVADHVITAANGGAYEPSNLRGACWHCNSVRGGQAARPNRAMAERAAVPGPAPVDGPTLLRSRRLR